MQQVVTWFGWGNSIGALAGVSAVLTVLVVLMPVVVGMIFSELKRLELKLIGAFSPDLAFFCVVYLTFPGCFIHELSHLLFAVITGAEVKDVCFFENENGRLGHVTTRSRGPWFIVAIQYTLIAVAPVVIGVSLGFVLLRYIYAEPHSLCENIGLWYLVVSLINHSTMSKSDIDGYFRGVWLFLLPLFATFFIMCLIN